MKSKYVLERVSHEVVELGRHNHSMPWRDYHNKWHTAFWELMYHKHSSYKQLLDLNHKQAARIMELEHDLRMARRTHE